jgi:hypothetical protein
MANSLNTMSLAELQEMLNSKVMSLAQSVGRAPTENTPQPTSPPEPPITDMPLAQARKAAASKATL